MFISLLGIQGSGKGTQARLLQDKYNFKIFETGAKIRELAKQETELGKKIKLLIDNGKLVPIEVISDILVDFMQDIGRNHNVIFDGIPRNIEQKEIFERYVKDIQVIHFDLTKEDAIARITHRTICSKCNKTFSSDYTDQNCASCGGEIIKRNDDLDIKSIEKRIDIFEKETMPVIYEYKGKGVVSTVNANGKLEDVAKEIAEKLDIKH